MGKRRDAWLVEYYATALTGVKRAGAHFKDAPNNTFIALRMNTTDPAFTELGSGEILYAEFTDVHDWNFKMGGTADFHELYDLKRDPHQLQSLYQSSSRMLRQ